MNSQVVLKSRFLDIILRPYLRGDCGCCDYVFKKWANFIWINADHTNEPKTFETYTMRIYLLPFIIGAHILGCDENAIRSETSRPINETEDVPQYDLEENEDIASGQEVTISISDTTLKIPSGATTVDSSVRLRTFKTVPEIESLSELGDPKGDIVEIKFVS